MYSEEKLQAIKSISTSQLPSHLAMQDDKGHVVQREKCILRSEVTINEVHENTGS